MRKPCCLCTKKSNNLERTCKDESSSKSVKVVANVCMQVFSFATRQIILSYNYRASDPARKNTFCSLFHQKILIVGLIVKFYKPFSQ